MLRTIRRIALASILIISSSTPSISARFPNAIEKTIVLKGPQAVAIVELFGLPSSKSTSTSLPLHKGNAWAIYLLKQDTPKPLSNANEGCPARFNKLDFSSGIIPTLSISPFWLDFGTKLPNSEPYTYSFSSPFISNNVDESDAWSTLISRVHAQPEWNEGNKIEFERSFDFPERKVTIQIYSDKDYSTNSKGHVAYFTVKLK